MSTYSLAEFGGCKIEELAMPGLFENNAELAWSMFHKTIVNFMGGEQPAVVVQPLATAERVEWDRPDPKPEPPPVPVPPDTFYYSTWLRQRLTDQMPTWGPLYVPRPGTTVGGELGEYNAFLDVLNTDLIKTAPVSTERLKKLDDERKTAIRELLALEREIQSDWEEYKAIHGGRPPISKAEWERQYGYSGARLNLRRRADAANGAYLLEANKVGGDVLEVGRAINALGDSRQKLALPTTPQEALEPKENWQYWYRSNVVGDINSFLSEERPFEITIAQEQSRTENFTTRWDASVVIGWMGFFGLGGTVEHEEMRSKMERDTQKMVIKFRNLQTFPIERGQWFGAGLISRFEKRVHKENEAFFGRSGRLNLIPATVLLARGMECQVDTTNEVSEFVSKRTSASVLVGVRVGPFFFGGRGGAEPSTSHTGTYEKTETGFKVNDASGRASVLAVISVRPADRVELDSPFSLVDTLTPEEQEEAARLVESERAKLGDVGPAGLEGLGVQPKTDPRLKR